MINNYTAICEVMKEAYSKGWIGTLDGNISFRYGATPPMMTITPSGVRKQKLHDYDLVDIEFKPSFVSWDDIIPKDTNPSGELPMHYLLQETIHSRTRAVVHLHPPHIIAAARFFDLSEITKNYSEIPTKVGKSVGRCPAQSDELGRKVFEAFSLDSSGKPTYDVVAIENHGVVAIGNDPWDALVHIERLNHICEIELLCRK
jgi:ribulose-5-phosphate 4-epimerase/fuculose-1-phosphate aldolase